MITLFPLSDACNRLLQGERAAVQCYDHILKRFGSDPRIEPLKFIKGQHVASARELELIAIPSDGAALFDTVSWPESPETVDLMNNLFGERSAIDFLIGGELALKSCYEGVFEKGICRDPILHSLFSIVLLPRSQRHVVALARLKELFGERANGAFSFERISVFPWAAAPARWN